MDNRLLMTSHPLNRSLILYRLLVLATCFGFLGQSATADWRIESGLNELRDLLGDDAPDGSGVFVSQVEAPTGVCCNNYYPNLTSFPFQSEPGYTQPTLVNNSSVAHPTPGFSNHATNVVGVNLYSKNGMAPGANTIIMYEANDYISTFLNGTGSSAPDVPDFVDPADSQTKMYKVQNHSWAIDHDGTGGFGTLNSIRVLLKVDYLVDEHELISIVGVENQGVDPNTLLVNGPRPDHDTVLAFSFNSLAVGVSTGWHAIGNSDVGYGNGRSKPSLVAPAAGSVGSASSSTAMVSGAAAMLQQQVVGTDAEKSEVARAILMAGATKGEFMDYWDQDASPGDPNQTVDWNRDTMQPLDEIFGAGELNVLNNYLIGEGGQYSGSSSSGSPTPVGSHGWDYNTASNSESGSRFYEFEVPDGSLALDFSVMLTWNADITSFSNASSFNLADMDLTLYDPNGTMIESSDSANDNVEHIYIGGGQALEYLGPGTYKLEVGNDDVARDFGLAWRTTTAYGTDPNNLITTADFDQSGVVDAGDFLTLQRNLGTLLNASLADGDADGDGDVDQWDLDIFNNQFGLSSVSNVVGIPEPGTLALVALAALGFALPGRRQHRK